MSPITQVKSNGSVLVEIGKQLPNWQSIQDHLSKTQSSFTTDFYSHLNFGVCYVFYENMTQKEINTITHSPFLCGISGTIAAVVDLRFPNEDLYLTSCINTKYQTPEFVHKEDAWYSLRIIAVEATTGEVKAMRGCELPPVISSNLNKAVVNQSEYDAHTVSKHHQNYLWLNPMHQLGSNVSYVKIGF
ncbi:hypothetical protein RGL50_004038 [Vibrio alginolyticus]|nr:hypothetical protein [Vibrio alginolyticus]